MVWEALSDSSFVRSKLVAEIEMVIDRIRKIAIFGLLTVVLGVFLYSNTSWGRAIGMAIIWIGLPIVWYAVIRGQLDFLKKIKRSIKK